MCIVLVIKIQKNVNRPKDIDPDSKDVWVAAATMATAPAGAQMQYGRHSASADPAARTAPYRLCHANRPERACLWQVRKRTAAGQRPRRECARHPRVYVVDFIRNFMASTVHAGKGPQPGRSRSWPCARRRGAPPFCGVPCRGASFHHMVVHPMYPCRGRGTPMWPSAPWWFSIMATMVRVVATRVLLSVCT